MAQSTARTADYDMRAFYPTIDTILYGRKTYDCVLEYFRKKGIQNGMFDKKIANRLVLAR
jgi:hypothetical protein